MRSLCPEVEAKWPPRDHAGRILRFRPWYWNAAKALAWVGVGILVLVAVATVQDLGWL